MMSLFRLLIRLAILTGLVISAVVLDWRLTAEPLADLVAGSGRLGEVVHDWTLDRLVLDLGSGLLLVATVGLAAMVGLAVTATLTAGRAPGLAAACGRLTPAGCRGMVT